MFIFDIINNNLCCINPGFITLYLLNLLFIKELLYVKIFQCIPFTLWSFRKMIRNHYKKICPVYDPVTYFSIKTPRSLEILTTNN